MNLETEATGPAGPIRGACSPRRRADAWPAGASHAAVESPLGTLHVVLDGAGAVLAILFGTDEAGAPRGSGASAAGPAGTPGGVAAARGREPNACTAPAGADATLASARRLPQARAALAGPVAQQLEAYFAGRRRCFDLALAPTGTAFQRRVWQALLHIPYGTTESYGALAARLGGAAHPRAVGSANGRNPIPIVIPCHRVIGADGRLTGYGGGLGRKRRLLALEGAPWRE